MDFITEANVIAVLTAILVGVAKTGVSGMAILVVPLMAMVFPAKESVGALLPMLITGIAGVAGYNALSYFRDRYPGQVVGMRPVKNWRLRGDSIEACDVEDPDMLRPWAMNAYRAGAGQNEKTPLFLIGAPFQIKVWEALLRIPTGHVTTYSDIARVIGNPKAVRAVGTAVGRNPISWLIPCHRALRKSGALGGYHWGLPVKRAMLAWETAETA